MGLSRKSWKHWNNENKEQGRIFSGGPMLAIFQMKDMIWFKSKNY